MEFVLFALECGEESADAGEGAAAVFDEGLLGWGQVVPRDVGGDVSGFAARSISPWWGAVLGGGPGSDGAFGQGLRAVGDDEVGIEVDGVAEALAAGAGSVGVVEGEEAGFGLAVGSVAGSAFEGGGKAEVLGCGFGVAGDGVELDFTGLAVTGLDGVYDSCAGVGGDGEAVDEDEDGGIEVQFE